MKSESPVGFQRATVARSMPSFLARYADVSADRLLSHAGITPEVLADPNGLLDFRRWVELFDLAATACGDPAFGATFANQVPWRDLGALGYVIFNSPTLGAGLGNACRYLGIQQRPCRARLEHGDVDVRLIFEIDHAAIPHHAQVSEGMLALFARICREGLQNAAWTPREVQFIHRAPASLDAHAQAFRCPISFEQPVDALVLSAADLGEPMPGADPALLPIMIKYAEESLAKAAFDGDFTTKVTGAVISSLSTGEVTIEHVARRVGASARTIQRRLRDQGLSFKDLVDRARFSLAKRYLSDSALTLTEAAFLLGYSDLSAFSRAFRRWSGRSALEFRRDQLRGA